MHTRTQDFGTKYLEENFSLRGVLTLGERREGEGGGGGEGLDQTAHSGRGRAAHDDQPGVWGGKEYVMDTLTLHHPLTLFPYY